MVKATIYPPADRKAQWRGTGGTTMPDLTKVLWHSTESGSWPEYPNFQPTMTYNPWTHQWRQHLPLNGSASTLADPAWTPVKENRANVVQVEIVGTCDPKIAGRSYYLAKMNDTAYEQLVAFVVFMHREWGVPLTAVPTWMPYPASYGKTKARLTSDQYVAFRGHLGHSHAPGNDHGDPGNVLDITRILKAADRIINPPPPSNVPGSWTVTATKLNGRAGASVDARVKLTRRAGQTFYAVREEKGSGMTWLVTRFGTRYAKQHCTPTPKKK